MRKLKLLWQWFDDRTGTSELVVPLAKHLVPADARWLYVFGSATLFSFILQVVTGVGLSLLYQPSSETAYASLKYITDQAVLGYYLRAIHYWGASAMILFVGIHMIRVYLTAAYKYPREMSWISGLVLLGLTLGMGFTGQLLRWDSNGIWSAVVGAEQAGRIPLIGKFLAHFLLGGETLGGATLSRIFAIHVFLIPALLFGLLGLHLYLVIRNGISEPPVSGQMAEPENYRQNYEHMLEVKGVPFWPNASWRDTAFGLLVVAGIIFLAVVVGPPHIGTPPDPASIHSNPRPDWYFLWIFALFALMPRLIESFVIAFGPVLAVIVLFAIPFVFGRGERSPIRRPWSIGIIVFIVLMIAVLWYEGIKAPWSPDFDAKPLQASVIGQVSPEADQGARLMFSKGCLFCHNISGDGGHRGPGLTDVGNRLTADELTIKIVNGGGNMPAFGPSLTKQELSDIVAFLQTRKSH